MFRALAWGRIGIAGMLAASARGLPQGLPPGLEPRLGFEEANELSRDPRRLALAYAAFDTRGPEPEIAADLRARPSRVERGYFLAQFHGPIDEALKSAVAATGAELLDYVPNFAFVVRATAAQRRAAASLARTAWSGELHPAYRLESRLRAASADPSLAGVARPLTVLGFRGVDETTLAAQVEAAGVAIEDSFLEDGRVVLHVLANPVEARELARSLDVQWVEPASETTLRNNNMVWTVQTNQNGDTKLWSKGLHGEGQVLGHVDGGINLNSCFFDDPSGAPIGPAHRKLVAYTGTVSSAHGTHTAGSAAGDAGPVSGSTLDRGLAYLARIAHTDVPIASFDAVATGHAAAGARIHTNSWGDDTTTAYNAMCVSIDSFLRQNEDHLAFFSVSNSPTVTNPENAKNLVAVSASQNGVNSSQFCFGGTGPTPDGRRKPDLLAPGCAIVSAAPGPCATGSLTGTSMACPAAAAAGVLVRQYFADGFHPSGAANPADAFAPSGALVKAVLLNTTQDLAGVAGYPTDTEGWGRINLDESLYFVGDATKLFALDVRHANGLVTGQSSPSTVFVQSTAVPLEVTLAFCDAPGTVNAADPVVNDLDLVVVSPGGAQYRGNVFSGGWSAAGGAADARNNVEHVAVLAPEIGAWTLTVTGANVPVAPQGFALCATGDIAVGGTSSPVAYCTSSQTSNLCVPRMTSAGVARVSSASGFTLAAHDVEGNRQGLIFYGVQGRHAAPWAPGSTSTLCVRQPLQRTPPHNSGGATGSCAGVVAVDWSAFLATHPGALGTPLSAGQLVQAQAWFRDPNAPGSTNLSDGLEFTVRP
jgi:hypothetical protein